MFALLSLCLLAPADDAARAREFVEQLKAGQFTEAVRDFDAKMTEVMPAPKLKETWESLGKQVGALKEMKGTRTESRGKYQMYFVACEFERMKLEARVVFDPDHKISGFGFQPPKPPVEYKSPDYVKADAFRERDVTVNAGGEWPLPATLSVPTGNGPFPAIVLVHGSGAHDRDETIGPNKPFKDLAGGLASRGIVVLRYVKRTKEHSAKLKADAVTLKDEVEDDAVAAAKLLRSIPEVDPKRVYVLGHSLGAMAAPRVAATDAGLAGIVLMAGAARPLEDVILEQITYISERDANAAEMLKGLKEKVARVKDPKLSSETPASDLPLGIPAAYWLSIRGLEPAGLAASLKCRILVLQGDRDYQVTLDDYSLFEKALAGKPHATLRRFANLNHLFMDGRGKATPAEYEKAGHVAPEVIEAIATWINPR